MVARRALILSAAVAAAFAVAAPAQAQQRTTVEFWHGLTQPLGGILEDLVKDFNNSQTQYTVNPVFKGAYPETMAATIAAFRAGNPPHIVQMFEVGTATMMAAKGAIKPVYQLMEETGTPFNPSNYVGAVAGYYTTTDGKMLSLPFNSSTPVMFYNKDMFKKAGLDPNKPPATWKEISAAAKKIVDSGAAKCGLVTAWPTWAQIETFSAMHDVPLGTKQNGFGGLDTVLEINSPLHVRHMQDMMDLQKAGYFVYGGRDSAGEPQFPSGDCAMIESSSGLRARIIREAKFDWGVGMLPYYDDVIAKPKNSIIGGASLWVMSSPSRKAEEYKAVAAFFAYLAKPEVDSKWHMDTGYVPVTKAGAELTVKSGFYDKNPGADIPIKQLLLTEPTANSKGLRFGNMPEIRVIWQEEMEKAFQGQQTAKQAMDNSVNRGNAVLRAFERANGS